MEYDAVDTPLAARGAFGWFKSKLGGGGFIENDQQEGKEASQINLVFDKSRNP